MWIQSMPVQTSPAVGKAGQGFQGNGATAATGADFAAWLQASLDGMEALSPGTAAEPNESLAVSESMPDMAEESLLDLLQEWLAAALQPLLKKEAQHEDAGDVPVDTLAEDVSQQGYTSPIAVGQTAEGESVTLNRPLPEQQLIMAQQILSLLRELSTDNSTGFNETDDLLRQVVRLLFPSDAKSGTLSDDAMLNLLETVRGAMTAADAPLANAVRPDNPMGNWLLALSQKMTQPSDADTDGNGFNFSHLTDDLGWEDVGTKTGTVENLWETLQQELTQRGIRAGVGYDGNSGTALQDGFRVENPSVPVREANPFFQTVRLILTRFETLEGRGYEARFQLYPEQLGTVHVKIVMQQGVLQAQLVVDTRMAKEALEAQVQSLQQAFAQQGLQVEKIEVTVREDALSQWYEQHAFFYQEHRQQGNGSQGGHTSGSSGGYVTDEIEEEELSAGTGANSAGSDADLQSRNGIDLSV